MRSPGVLGLGQARDVPNCPFFLSDNHCPLQGWVRGLNWKGLKDYSVFSLAGVINLNNLIIVTGTADNE